MYKVLVVDDEKLERDGIKLLIKKYNLELDVSEAENGRTALEHIRNNPVDILFTDIKMPFMDGLELAEKAKALIPGLKVIIYSAYGEFDLAKKAINIKVEHYILKPINKEEFRKVFVLVLEQCRKEAEESLEYNKILELSRKGLEYEKERVLLDIINGLGPEENFAARLQAAGLTLSDRRMRLVLFDFKSRFFDNYNDEFKALLKESLEGDYEYLNMNERQSLVFLLEENGPAGTDELRRMGEGVNARLLERFGLTATVVAGDSFGRLGEIGEEMNKIEQVLDCKFFYDEDRVLFTAAGPPEEYALDSVEAAADRIYQSIDDSNLPLFQKETGDFFDRLKRKGSFSTIFVKYICAEIVKRVHKRTGDTDYDAYKTSIENIFRSESLDKLRELVQEAASKLGGSGPYDGRVNMKVIRDVIELIESNYMNDISIEWIAEKAYLTPNYLNYLFKKEVGQSLGKYITYYRLKKAEKLLTNTNMKIADVGSRVGYTNSSYFCLIFRNYYGVTPIKYREMRK